MRHRTILVFAGIFIIMGLVSGYFPPTYIANQGSGECTYYFAGDEKHYNPLPNGSWIMVGLAEENRTVCQLACLRYSVEGEIWNGLDCYCLGEFEEGCTNWCRINKGEWAEDGKKCVCPIGMEWGPEEGCVKSPDYPEAITECSREISATITKLGLIEKRLNQSENNRESLKEEFEKLKEEFSNLKSSRDDADALDESVQKIDNILSGLDIWLADSGPAGDAVTEVGSLKETLSGYGFGEDIEIQENVNSDESTLWVGLFLIVVVTLAGIYYVSRG